MPTTWNALFLGTSGSFLDPTEGNRDMEGAGSFVGQTFGSTGDPLTGHIVSVTAINNGGPDDLDTDNGLSNDNFQFDLGDGSGTQTTVYDGITVYNATLTYTDGTTASITAIVAQDTDGNLFLAPELSDNADKAAMEAKPIRALTLDSVNNSNNLNVARDRVATNFVCYVAGTQIWTPTGPRAVETLRRGERVLTLDGGAQPVRWLGASRVAGEGKRMPVRIQAGALGGGLPQRDLLVSRQHRMLVASKIARRMFGTDEVLVPAFRFVGLPGIAVAEDMGAVAYHHLLFERHEIVLAEGAPAESLLPGPTAMEVMGAAARIEMLAHCPDIAPGAMAPARPIPEPHQQRRLVERHGTNAKPLLELWTGALAPAC